MNSQMTPLGCKSYCIGGVSVLFPCQPYPAQVAMMGRIITSLQKRQNCLVESPTGSGKSLAILCSAVAWQNKEKEKLKADFLAQMSMDVAPEPQLENDKENLARPVVALTKVQATSGNRGKNFWEDDDDFKPKKKFTPHRKTKGVQFYDSPEKPNPTTKLGSPIKPEALNFENVAPKELKQPTGKEGQEVFMGKPKLPPKIFVGTRTHKQIAQLIRELKKTPYRNAKMCILSSRERTCIHPQVSTQPNKNEGCRELRDKPTGPACAFYRAIMTQRYIPQFSDSAWDIEDVVRYGKKAHICPYYYLRELMKEADIIFCPYNYLIDSQIRAAMEITLNNHVVILDEAHNIEDAARSAASFSLTLEEMTDAVTNLEEIIKAVPKKTGSCRGLAEVLSGLSNWIHMNSDNLTDFKEFEKSGKILSGQDLVAILSNAGAGPKEVVGLRLCFEDLLDDPNSQEKQDVGLVSSTMVLFRGIFTILDYLYRNGMKFMPDYKGALVKSISQGRRMSTTPGRWMNKTNPGSSYTLTLNFWCLNPAVAISDFKNDIHSLVVTSGTLSPMASFESELNMPFPFKLETNHVVNRSQIWIGTVGLGPTGTPLNAVFRNTETFAFQDEVGKVIYQVCSVVTHGVLCFFPSYAALDKLANRWRITGLWEELSERKTIVCEPRSLDSRSLESVMEEFYNAVQESSEGALFLAVCRGKVSEGLDFADNNARAVITVGIPFPNIKDIQVNLKKEYNNRYKQERGIMSGNDWYETQAFRALNQALGRCIRHKDDWGALILMDERFQKNSRYVLSLSKWIRNEVVHHHSFGSTIQSLQNFVSSKKDIKIFSESLNSPAPSSMDVSSTCRNDLAVDAQFCTMDSACARPKILNHGSGNTGSFMDPIDIDD